MKKFFSLSVLILLSTFIIGCQSEGNNNELKLGETYDTGILEVTPTDIEIGTEENQIPEMEVEPQSQVAVIDVILKNTSDSSVVIDRDFYYESFGVLVEDEPGIGRMDTDAFPFDGVFLDELGEGETVDTRLIIYHSVGANKLVFDNNGDLENGYVVSWKID